MASVTSQVDGKQTIDDQGWEYCGLANNLAKSFVIFVGEAVREGGPEGEQDAIMMEEWCPSEVVWWEVFSLSAELGADTFLREQPGGQQAIFSPAPDQGL